MKPLEPAQLRRAVRALLEGGTFEDDALAPGDRRWRPALTDG